VTEQSRRVELCPECLDRRERLVDFLTFSMSVILPRACVCAATCQTEMQKPFDPAKWRSV
jgi:hypothetical protein